MAMYRSEFLGLYIMNLAQQAKQDLHWRILSGQLRPGQVVTVRSAASLLDIGITPARDALMALRQEGLVEVRASGTVVREWTTEEMRAHYQLRLAIEKVALHWAAENMSSALHRKLMRLCDLQEEFSRKGEHQKRTDTDREFHASLIGAAHNKEVTRVAGFLKSLGPILPGTAQRYSLAESLATVEEHRQIVNFLLDGEADLAAEVLERHLTSPLARIAESSVGKAAGALVSVGVA